jgi:Sec-independent protein translocase protein TatA
MEKGLWSTSAHVVALGLVLGADPKKIAEIMVSGDEKIKEFSKQINEEIKRLEEEAHKGHDHGKGDHGHEVAEKAE